MPPYPTDPHSYPREFEGLFSRATSERVEIQLSSAPLATNLRHQLHAFRRASERANVPNARNFRSVLIRSEGSLLILEPNPALAELREVLGDIASTSESTSISDDALDEYIQKTFGEET